MRIFRTLTFTLAILMNLASHAQDSRSVNLSAGLLYPNTLDATLSYEIETKYHNAWEFFANGAAKWKDCPSCGHVCAESFWKDHPTWGVGVAYKPCVLRYRNAFGRVRIGASLGSNTDKFLGGIHLGYEHNTYCQPHSQGQHFDQYIVLNFHYSFFNSIAGFVFAAFSV